MSLIHATPAHTVHTIQADGIEVFYRESGRADAPVLLLLHGFPTSSLSYRHLLAGLSDKYRVIAPDLPGFGFTNLPAERNYVYTFDNIGKTVLAFIDALSLTSYVVYGFDYGMPTLIRIALDRPQAIQGIVSQNGNAFVEGLGDFWDNIRPYWKDPSVANRDSIKWLTSFDATKFQYVTGETDPSTIPPETYHLDAALLARPGNQDIQLDLFLDYQHNLSLYPAFHAFLKKHQPPLLAIWGNNDPIFIPPGAEAFKTILDKPEIHFVDGGHFTLENHSEEIITEIRRFLLSDNL